MAAYEIAVAGGGPAGLTAAFFAARHGRSTVVLDPVGLGGAVLNTTRVEDFPGFPEGVPGFDLVPRIHEQVADAGATLELGEVRGLEQRGGDWRVLTDSGEIVAGAVIVATGSKPRRLGVPREDEFEGKGLSHCASCDGPLYKGKAVAMVGSGDSALLEALELTEHDLQVVLVHEEESFSGQEAYGRRVRGSAHVDVRHRTVLEEILGDGQVDGVRVRDLASGESSILPVAAIFAHVGRVPNTGFLDGVLDARRARTHTDGHVDADRAPGAVRSRRRASGRRGSGDHRRRRRRDRGHRRASLPGRARTVRAWRLSDSFGIDRLELDDRRDPPLGPGEVRIRVRAVSLNHRDVLMVEHGVAPRGVQLPLLPCSDAGGEVVEIGSGVSRVKEGDRVATIVFQGWLEGDTMQPAAYGSVLAGGLDGVLADHVVLHEDGLVHVPEHLSDEEASTLPCAALTAWHALVTKGRVRAGETILAQGTGGVSIFALQFGLMAGARVIVTSSSDEKLARARALGAWETINYVTMPDWAERALELTGGTGVDHVVEVGGSATTDQSIKATRPGGTVSLIGVLTGFEARVDPHPVILKGLRVHGIRVGSRAMFEDMNRAIASHGLRPVIDRVFQFDQAREALRHLQGAGHVGKVVISV